MSGSEKIYIPVVPNEKIFELSLRIKPVVMFPKKGLCYIRRVDLFDTAFTWDPKSTKKASGLKALSDIRTYHRYGAPVFFKPSIAEVLAQIPEEYLDSVVAFEIVQSPKTADDLNKEREATNAGYHVATTRLYILA